MIWLIIIYYKIYIIFYFKINHQYDIESRVCGSREPSSSWWCLWGEHKYSIDSIDNTVWWRQYWCQHTAHSSTRISTTWPSRRAISHSAKPRTNSLWWWHRHGSESSCILIVCILACKSARLRTKAANSGADILQGGENSPSNFGEPEDFARIFENSDSSGK